MTAINVRGAYEFDPYGVEGAGGLLGMLQAMMHQGQIEAGANLNPRIPGNETPTVRQMSGYGQTPPTHINLRPIDVYSPSGSENQDSAGGLLGRLLAQQAEQSRYQPTPLNSGQIQSAPQNPNFRQLSRVSPAVQTQGGVGPFGGSTSPDLMRASRQGDKAAQPDHSLSDRIKAYWNHPHPYGLVSMLKEALNGAEQAVQGSIHATSVSSTEEEAFRQNQGRELGPIGALKAASRLPLVSPAGAGRILARPLGDGLRNGLSWSMGARIRGQGIEGPIANTSAPPIRFVSPNRNLSWEPRSAAAVASAITELAGINAQNPPLLLPIPEPAFPDWNGPFKQQMASRKGGGRKRGDGEDGPTVESEWYKNFKEQMAKQAASRKAAAERAGRQATQGGGDDENVCDKRKREEKDRCYARKDEYAHSVFLSGCLSRATNRWDLCNRNGHRLPRREPPEWGPGDEDVYFETDR
jgi:hypothetical protein